tara:strand:- start:61 stop:366 length:306 start_codon:yes stop_codon:yes gene_type:complete
MAIKTQESQPQIAAKTKTKTAKNFDPKDIELLRSHQSKTDQLIIQLGQISLQKYQLDQTEQNLKQEINKLREEEQKMATEFTSRYGKGTLDLGSGAFTPQD